MPRGNVAGALLAAVVALVPACGGDDVVTGTDLPFGSECSEDSQCQSGKCFDFSSKGPHCTIDCPASGSCPSPSTGCSGMGVCKID